MGLGFESAGELLYLGVRDVVALCQVEGAQVSIPCLLHDILHARISSA